VTPRRVGHCAFSVHADLGDMFPHVKLIQSVTPCRSTAISAASDEGMHIETALLRLKIRALGKGAETVYGVSCHVGGTGVCVSGCIFDDREKEPEA
jgi:hypothetical protein